MTPAEAIAHLQRAVDTARPGCFVQVSPMALVLALGIVNGPIADEPT